MRMRRNELGTSEDGLVIYLSQRLTIAWNTPRFTWLPSTCSITFLGKVASNAGQQEHLSVCDLFVLL